jgi:2-isopropylmalate synthase
MYFEQRLYLFESTVMEKIKLYDTTLRDGMQAEGVSFSLEDKLSIAKCLDQLGVHYIEGGYAGSNPKETQFFAEVANLGLQNSRIVAFGNTRRAKRKVVNDESLNAILACKTSTATLVGKTWDMHVRDVLGCSLDENLRICAESVEYLKKQGLETFFDAEHFFDGYKNNPEFAMKVLEAVAGAGVDAMVLCDTNGGSWCRRAIHTLAVAGDREALPFTYRGRVGVRGPGGH